MPNTLIYKLCRLFSSDDNKSLYQRSKGSNIALCKEALIKQGWELRGNHKMGITTTCDLAARKGNIKIALLCAGSDKDIYVTDINDLTVSAQKNKFTTIAVYNQKTEDQCNRIRLEKGYLCISLYEILDIEQVLKKAKPIIIGGVDTVVMPRSIQGWVGFVPDCGKARIEVYLEQKLVGDGIADRFRKDLIYGDGRFGFNIEIQQDMDLFDVNQRLLVKAYLDQKYIGQVRLWHKAKIS